MPQNVSQLIAGANDSLDKLRQVRPRRRTEVACSECSKHHRRCEPPEEGQRQCKRCARHNIECSLNKTQAPQDLNDSRSHPPALHGSSYVYNTSAPNYQPPVVASQGVPNNYGVVSNPGLGRYHEVPYAHNGLSLQTEQWPQVDAGNGRGSGSIGAGHSLSPLNMSTMQRGPQYQTAQGYSNWPGMRSSGPPLNTSYEYASNGERTTRQAWAPSPVGQRRDSGFTQEYMHHPSSMSSQSQGLYIPPAAPYDVHQASPIQQHPQQRFSDNGQLYMPESNSTYYSLPHSSQ